VTTFLPATSRFITESRDLYHDSQSRSCDVPNIQTSTFFHVALFCVLMDLPSFVFLSYPVSSASSCLTRKWTRCEKKLTFTA